jgi:hypothetical protein
MLAKHEALSSNPSNSPYTHKNKTNKTELPGMVVHACNPSSQEAEIKRFTTQGQAIKKLARLCLKSKTGVVVHIYNLSYPTGLV